MFYVPDFGQMQSCSFISVLFGIKDSLFPSVPNPGFSFAYLWKGTKGRDARSQNGKYPQELLEAQHTFHLAWENPVIPQEEIQDVARRKYPHNSADTGTQFNGLKWTFF